MKTEIRIKFNVPPYAEKAGGYIQECVAGQKICGDGVYTKKCNEWIEARTGIKKCLLTTSLNSVTAVRCITLFVSTKIS